MNFEIDEAYLTSITIHKVFRPCFQNTEEDLIKALKYSGTSSSTSSEDHPEFSKLREQLGKDGYIHIQRGWWNGDSVIKPFTLNGKKFKKGEQFPSACAMAGHLKFMK